MSGLSRRRLSIALVLLSLIQLTPGAIPSRDFSLNFKQDDQSTRISITGEHLIAVKLLNAPPDAKIILKITHPAAFPAAVTEKKMEFPALSAITRIKITPIDDKSSLLIIRLAEKLPFTLTKFPPGEDIRIADAPYHQPLEHDYRMGIYYQKKQNLEKALNLYRRVVFKNRKHRYAYFKAGQIRLGWKQFRLAEINFRHARENGCDSTGLYRDMASLYQLEGNARLANIYRNRFHKLSQKQGRAAGKDSSGFSAPIRIQVVSNVGAGQPAKTDSAQIAGTAPASPGFIPAAAAKMPKKILLYLIGIVLAGVFLMITLLRNLLRKQPLPAFPSAKTADDRIPVSDKKERLMRLARNALEGSTSENARREESPTSHQQNPVLLADIPVRLPEDSGTTDIGNAPSSEENSAPPREMARELNLGLGEVELALNLTSEQRRHHQDRDLHRRIYALHLQNQTVPQIARTLNLGQNEVELILQFTEQGQSVE